MPTLTWNLTDERAALMVEAFGEDWPATVPGDPIPDPENPGEFIVPQVPNPQTKAQFAEDHLKSRVEGWVIGWHRSKDALAVANRDFAIT
jgi:hypothetical protein